MNYLTASELAALIGCESNSYACMCRWLNKNDWPYAKNLRGFPQVLRTYHDSRMSGQIAPGAAGTPRPRPNFAALKAAA